MPTFDTPQPLFATVEFDIVNARITASERTDTVVEVLPSDATDKADVQAAEQTEITCSGGKLQVKGPRKSSPLSKIGSVEVRVELPAGSDVQGISPMADFICSGRLGDGRFKTSTGAIHIETAATVRLETDHGTIRLDRATGDVEVTGSGRVDIGQVAGTATVKNSNGATTIGEVTGDLEVDTANGPIAIGLAHAGVDAKTTNGPISINEVVRGRITLETGVGDLEIGVRGSTAAVWEVTTHVGGVHNAIGPADGSGIAKEKVELRARTGMGDIVIRRT